MYILDFEVLMIISNNIEFTMILGKEENSWRRMFGVDY